jgi:polysaccharide deacetylase 2 family uncharacterized protein YibQ
MNYPDAVAIIVNDMGADLDQRTTHIEKLVEALQAADLYLNNYDTSKPSRIKAETRAIVAEALAL